MIEFRGREFYKYHGKERLTDLYFCGKIEKENIKNAIVFTFSKNNCNKILNTLLLERKCVYKKEYELNEDEEYQEVLSNEKIEAILGIAKKYNIKQESNIVEYAKYGLAMYFGKTIPKEKLFIEELFEKRLIDTVVGTDALALGVNFPVEKVIFAQLAKEGYGPISKNLFDQLAGRAGRKGYFDQGRVYYCDDFPNIELKNYTTKELYEQLLQQENESLKIKLKAKIGDILRGRSIEEEIKIIQEYSSEHTDVSEELIENLLEKLKNSGIDNKYQNEKNILDKQIRELKSKIKITSRNYIYGEECYRKFQEKEKEQEQLQRKYEEEKSMYESVQEEFEQQIANVYFDEYSVTENRKIFYNILLGGTTQEIIDNFCGSENFYDLLQLRKYAIRLPKQYRQAIDLQELEKIINEIDETALNENRGLLSIEDISKGTKKEQIEEEAIGKVLKVMDEQLGMIEQQHIEEIEV